MSLITELNRRGVTRVAIGLLPALILSWVFDFTPKGLRRETDASIAVPKGLACG
jgi:hypothetical protein